MVHHCPRCELRFRSDAEIKEHLRTDHRVQVDDIERYPEAHQDPPLYPDRGPAQTRAKRYLVVANRTLGGEQLRERIQALAGEGSGSFHLVVPADPQLTGEGGVADAQWRLRQTLDLFRGTGIDIDGEVGPADPLAAVAGALARETVDEVLVSTLPHDRSRWLGMDLPTRIRRQFRVPVVTVTAGR